MTYLSKETLLWAYKTLSTLSEDPSLQGATQKVSAIRYVLALDMFYKQNNRECNTRDSKDKAEFANNINKLVAINDSLYTTNFYVPLASHLGDCAVGSNFYSVGAVKNSLMNPSLIISYPQRGNKPLFEIQNGILYRKTEMLSNINSYILSDEHKFALALWIVGKYELDSSYILTEINKVYHSIFTNELCDLLCPTEGSDKCLKELHFTNQIAMISKSDIEMLFEAKHNTLKQLVQRQIIYYGAPGTGKSHTIQKATADAEQKGNLFRTTFHPDSDYATFVGCYKPSMESKERRYDKDELISKLAIIKNTGVTYPCHKFAAKYWESLKGMTRDEKKGIITACEFPETMVVEIDKGIVIGEELSHGTNQKQIVYRFVAQAFANAYVRAWQKNQEDEKVFLVIEEINRGNCAQIFGDLFQLLDRDDEGYSKYPIIPDADLADFICEHLQTYENIPEAIREGLEMKLPSNFYIWASMNTSDQSLFPIDSAFKRRWDWEYIPIENHPDEDYKIHINGSVYDWWDFIQAINKEVFELTHSEDKQLGYFFVRPQNGIIDANMLVNKVYFYLWNDVFKDYDIESQKAFKKPDSNEAIAFKDFFEGGLNEKLAEQVLINLELGEEIQAAE